MKIFEVEFYPDRRVFKHVQTVRVQAENVISAIYFAKKQMLVSDSSFMNVVKKTKVKEIK